MEVISGEDGDNFAEADASASDEGLCEDEILGLAQINAEEITAPKPIVSMTPSVHVQVTRVGYE